MLYPTGREGTPAEVFRYTVQEMEIHIAKQQVVISSEPDCIYATILKQRVY